MTTIEDCMKFMVYSEPISLPKGVDGAKEAIKKFDESCIVIKNLDVYFIGRPIMSKSNSVSYLFRELDGTETKLSYSNLRALWVPRNLCPEQLKI